MQFSWIDYLFFAGMLAVSAFIGIYYGCFGSKQSTTKEYLHGDKKMKIFPIAMSLTASHLSCITMLGMPSEIYLFGTQFWAFPISAILVMCSMNYVFLPVFYKLQLVSSYEYLSMRFDGRVRIFASLLFVISTLLYVPVVIYGSSLAFGQVTGIELYKIYPVVCSICIFYTTLGGLKAVVLSDALQFTVTFGTMLTVMVLGIEAAGGFARIWQRAESTGRIEFFNMDLNPTTRNTFWAISLGLTTIWISNLGLNPSSVQRCLAMPSFAAVRRSVWIFGASTIVTKSISCFSGLTMFAKYADCDPLSTGMVDRPDQLLPYFVLETTGHITGLPGLFIAGVFSTALSTMSTSLNTLAGTIYEDFIKSRMPVDISERKASNIMKLITVTIGTISMFLVFVVEKLGDVLQVSLSLFGITMGPLLGLFSLGMLFPSANTNGALSGGIVSTAISSVLVGGAQIYHVRGSLQRSYKPLSTSGCDFNATIPAIISAAPPETTEEPFAIFSISHYFFVLIGTLLVLIIGLPVSWSTRKAGDAPVDYDLLSPCVRCFLPERPSKLKSPETVLKETLLRNEKL